MGLAVLVDGLIDHRGLWVRGLLEEWTV